MRPLAHLIVLVVMPKRCAIAVSVSPDCVSYTCIWLLTRLWALSGMAANKPLSSIEVIAGGVGVVSRGFCMSGISSACASAIRPFCVTTVLVLKRRP